MTQSTDSTDRATSANPAGGASTVRRAAMRALALVMGAAAVGWLLFMAGQYLELARFTAIDWTYDQPEQVNYTQFLTVAAIAVPGLGALLAKRRLAALRAESSPRSRLVDSVSHFTSVMLILVSALAAFAVFATFMGGFFSGATESVPLARTVNLYLPIVLYIALVVVLILAGFVFMPPVARRAHGLEGAEAASAALAASVPASAPEPAAAEPMAPRQRTVAFAYATPIVAAAVALLLGLIVYDATRTALQVWIWVVICAIVGAGVLAGAVLAERSAGRGAPDAPIVVGAKNLAFALSIVFAFVVACMSLGYGSSAVQQLSSAPSLSLSAYGSSESSLKGTAVAVEEPTLSLWGSDLKRGSEVVVTLNPGGERLSTAKVDSGGWVGDDLAWPEDLEPGDYAFVATGTATDGASIEVELLAVIGSDEAGSDGVLFPDGSTASFDTEKARLLPASAGWVMGDLLPAGVLLAFAIAMVCAILVVRGRDEGAPAVKQAPAAGQAPADDGAA